MRHLSDIDVDERPLLQYDLVLTDGLSDALNEQVGKAMTAYLKSHGFDTIDELDTRVQQVATGQDLADWQKLKNEYVSFFSSESLHMI